MDPGWAFAVLLVYPALQVPALYVVVRALDLRNDDGPRDPVGYAPTVVADGHGGATVPGLCPDCGRENDPTYRYCRTCLASLPVGPG